MNDEQKVNKDEKDVKKGGFKQFLKKHKTKVIIVVVIFVILIVFFLLGAISGGLDLNYIPV